MTLHCTDKLLDLITFHSSGANIKHNGHIRPFRLLVDHLKSIPVQLQFRLHSCHPCACADLKFQYLKPIVMDQTIQNHFRLVNARHKASRSLQPVRILFYSFRIIVVMQTIKQSMKQDSLVNMSLIHFPDQSFVGKPFISQFGRDQLTLFPVKETDLSPTDGSCFSFSNTSRQIFNNMCMTVNDHMYPPQTYAVFNVFLFSLLFCINFIE